MPVELDRGDFVEALGDEAGELSAEFTEAVERLRSACLDRIWPGGHSGGFSWSSGSRSVTLFVPYGFADQAGF
ncbi:hypothetical protein [Cryptosporangium arvum]|uniref:hypothetical protein n=1 Tax=Cryptosporangium arvum TaxID=80871 RepID=UPI0004BA913C|nr:hypothetical protein [Cryptosporangium arvum]